MRKSNAIIAALVTIAVFLISASPASAADTYTRSFYCKNGSYEVQAVATWFDGGLAYHDLVSVTATQYLSTGRTRTSTDWASSMTIAHRHNTVDGPVNKQVWSGNPTRVQIVNFPGDFFTIDSNSQVYLRASNGASMQCGPVVDTAV